VSTVAHPIAARRTTRRLRLGTPLSHLLLGGGGFLMMVPFFWLLSSSFKAPHEIFRLPPVFIPETFRWENYYEVLFVQPFPRLVRNTLIVTLPATLGQVVTASMAAYGFSRLRFPGRDKVFAALLATIMLPYAVTLIPVYLLFKQLGWLGTFLPLIVPFWFGGGAFNIFMLRQFFLSIPGELEEAALIDGAEYPTIFVRIILPLSMPALVVVVIFSFLQHWNDFLAPIIYLNNINLWTVAIGILGLKGALGARDTTHLMMAMSTLMVVPIVVIFFFAQRVFIQGIVLTGLKG
jgi:multiple sugar transport system permease protein